MHNLKCQPDFPEIASWCLAAAALWLVLWLHLLPALLAGLLTYELVHVIAPLLQRRFFSRGSRLAALVALSALIMSLVTATILGGTAFFHSDIGSLPRLFQRMAEIVEGARGVLPAWLVEFLPVGADELRNALSHWLREHVPEIRLVGTEAGVTFARILIGVVIGAIISLHEAAPAPAQKPLARALGDRARRLGESFRRVVFAQVRISALNTIFTTVYLVVLLPLFGVHLPLTKTLIGVTFVAGLVPVIGNLISNSVIVVVSLALSSYVAFGSLLFLIVIHKLEYFLNARIVGSQIHARVWELLLVMLTMEAAFGLPGVVAAPIYYAYVKQELADRGLV